MTGYPTTRLYDPALDAAECARRDRAGELAYDPNLWALEGRYAYRRTRTAEAVRICGVCPVSQLCFERALERKESHGIWGGVNFEVPGGTSPRKSSALKNDRAKHVKRTKSRKEKDMKIGPEVAKPVAGIGQGARQEIIELANALLALGQDRAIEIIATKREFDTTQQAVNRHLKRNGNGHLRLAFGKRDKPIVNDEITFVVALVERKPKS